MTNPDLLNQAISDTYDETPYTSNAFPLTAPGHLHALAHLYGLTAPAPATARVLELGCAAGGNLMPFALAHPDAEVIGVDLSPQQIAHGQELVAKIGLKNLDLRAMSLTDIDASFGKFDYIICHGVFSWVPPEVRDAILRICRENLSPEGVAYISYNTYPGWKTSDVVRDAMQLNSFAATTQAEKLQRAKEMLGLLQQGLWDGNPMKWALANAARELSKQSDYYLFHEYLETVNSPCYFLEFVAAIQQAGLVYLADAELHSTFPSTYGSNVAQHLAQLPQTTPEMREQYLDFAIGRQFRKSLIVHADRAPAMLQNPEGTKFADMHFGTLLKPQAATKPGEHRYETTAGTAVATESPGLHAVIETLRAAWPSSVPYQRLTEAVVAAMPDASADEQASAVVDSLIILVTANALHFRLYPIQYGEEAGAPRLIPGALELLSAIQTGASQVGMHNLWHMTVNPGRDDLSKFVTTLMNGSRSVQQLRTELRDALFSGKLPHPMGKAVKGMRNLDSEAQELLQAVLSAQKNAGLLH